jgi:hypothetical protein
MNHQYEYDYQLSEQQRMLFRKKNAEEILMFIEDAWDFLQEAMQPEDKQRFHQYLIRKKSNR